MEYVEGETLAARLAKGRCRSSRPWHTRSRSPRRWTRARAGIVHRDIKPDNIMVSRAAVKMLDFGLAKARRRAQAATRPGGRDGSDHPWA